MITDWQRYQPYFSRWEFDSPDVVGSGDHMEPALMNKLYAARHKAQVSFSINSGFRTLDWNRRVGGVPSSAHLGGWAADISAVNPRKRGIILIALVHAGFTRIGTYDWGFHVDCDPTKPSPASW